MKIKRLVILAIVLCLNLNMLFAQVQEITHGYAYNSFIINIATALKTIAILLLIDYIIFLIATKPKTKVVLLRRFIVTVMFALILIIASGRVMDIGTIDYWGKLSREEQKNYDKIGEPEIKLFQYIEW